MSERYPIIYKIYTIFSDTYFFLITTSLNDTYSEKENPQKFYDQKRKKNSTANCTKFTYRQHCNFFSEQLNVFFDKICVPKNDIRR